MMDHKTRQSMEAKGQVMLMIAAIGTDKKMELVNKYQDSTRNPLSKNNHRMLVGSWLNNAARLISRGATEEEVNSAVEHLQVLIMAGKYPMDIQRSHKEHRLLEICRKYFGPENPKDILRKRREAIEKMEKLRKEKKDTVKSMVENGCTIEHIANSLAMPESSVQYIALHLDDD